MTDYKKILHILNLPCLVLEPQGNDFLIIDANESYLAAVNARREKLEGQLASEIFRHNSSQGALGWELLEESLRRVMLTAKPHKMDLLRFDVDIETTDIHLKRYWMPENLPVLNDAGKVTLILHTALDVTQKVVFEQRERAILEEMARKDQEYQHFIEKNSDGLFSLDLEGNFTSANEGLARFANMEVGEILKMNFIPFCHPQDQDSIVDHFVLAIKGQPNTSEARYVSSQGRVRNLEISLFPASVEGKIVGVHGIAKDQTDLRKSEKVVAEKSNFLKANASFISRLLENEIESPALEEAFDIIGRAVDVDRMYYFCTHPHPETGDPCISQKMEWTSASTSSQLRNPQMQNMPSCEVYQVMGELTRNKPFSAVRSALEESGLRDIFYEQDIQSMLVLPVFLNSELFGFIGFDDCHQERIWSREEIEFLQSLAHNLTTSIEKRAAEERLREREETLRQSEQKFRALVQQGTDMMAIINEKGEYTFLSDTTFSILGRRPDEMLGKTPYDFLHPEDKERVSGCFKALLQEKQVKIPPFRFRHKNGQYRWIEAKATNLLNYPAVQGYVTNARDISTLLEQDREIKQLYERFALSATATQDLVYDVDLLTGEVIRFHRSVTNLYGYPVEEVDRRDFWDENIHPEDAEREARAVEECLQDPSRNYVKTEYRFRRADGTYAQVVDKAYLIRDENGRGIRLVGAISDISKLTEQKEALKSANKRYRMAMRATNEVIWDWDPDTGKMERSTAFSRVYGYGTKEAGSLDFWFSKVPQSERQRVQGSLQAAIADPSVKKWRAEYDFIAADGELRHVLDRGHISRDREGNALRMVGAVLDLTNSRRTMAQLKRQNDLLKEIAWEQSHLVRAPLARLQGLMELMEMEPIQDYPRPRIWEDIKTSAAELDNIIRQIVAKTEEMEDLEM